MPWLRWPRWRNRLPDALELAYRYLGHRERTVAEVRNRLGRAELPAGEIEEAITELVELGYLDDARYARVFTEDKRHLEHWGTDRIARVLRERGIEPEVVAAALGDAADRNDDQRALALLRRRFPEPSDDPRERERALGVLIRKGFESDLAYDAVRAWSAGPGAPGC